MESTRVELSIHAGLARITLDGPGTRNALDSASAAALIEACERIDHDSSVGAAVVTGAGGAFCSGANTRSLDRLRTASTADAYDGLGELYEAFQRFGRLGVPTIAAVDGPAVGAGVNLALAADLRVVTDRAVFVSGFARIGLHPGGGHLHLLARAAGAGTAALAGLFAQPIDVDRAVSSGLAAARASTADLPDLVDTLTRH